MYGTRYAVCMIKKTVYFRDQDDLDKFNAIKNKAKWLHERLNNTVYEDQDYIVSGITPVEKFENFVHSSEHFGTKPDEPTYEPMDEAWTLMQPS